MGRGTTRNLELTSLIPKRQATQAHRPRAWCRWRVLIRALCLIEIASTFHDGRSTLAHKMTFGIRCLTSPSCDGYFPLQTAGDKQRGSTLTNEVKPGSFVSLKPASWHSTGSLGDHELLGGEACTSSSLAISAAACSHELWGQFTFHPDRAFSEVNNIYSGVQGWWRKRRGNIFGESIAPGVVKLFFKRPEIFVSHKAALTKTPKFRYQMKGIK